MYITGCLKILEKGGARVLDLREFHVYIIIRVENRMEMEGNMFNLFCFHMSRENQKGGNEYGSGKHGRRILSGYGMDTIRK